MLGACSGTSSPPAQPSVTALPATSANSGVGEGAPRADRKRLEADVRALAIERYPGSPGWNSTRELCRERLESLGYQPEEDTFGVELMRGSGASAAGINVIGKKLGVVHPEQEIILSAHYDHVPGCHGADDDASGLAAIFEVARQLTQSAYPRTLVVACWDWEESGLLGSGLYAKEARERGEDIRLAVALDAVGFTRRAAGSQAFPPGLLTVAPRLGARLEREGKRGDFIGVVGDTRGADFLDPFEREAKRIGLGTAVLEASSLEQLVMNDVMRADHASFWLRGYPGILLTDTGEFRNPGYHCLRASDEPETLDYAFLAEVTSATEVMMESALRGEEPPPSE